MEPWARRIAELLEDGRARGLSEPGLAKACKAAQPSVWQWFNAPKGRKTTKNISAANLIAAAKYLGTTAEWLMTGQGVRSTTDPAAVDWQMLQSAIVTVKEAVQARGLELDAFVAAPMIAFAYEERLRHPRSMSRPQYRAFDAAVAAKLAMELGDERRGEGPVEGSGSRDAKATPVAAKAGRR